MTRRVELRPAAQRDLERLVDFLAALDERAADRRLLWLRESLRALGARPLKGRPGPHGLREHTLKYGRSSYLIRYVVTADAVIIVRIWHGKEAR